MTNRKRLGVLDELIHDFNEAGNKALGDAWKLENERESTLANIIMEDQLLAGLWMLVPSKTIIQLRNGDCKVGERLASLLGMNYPYDHSAQSLWDDIHLYFDDNTITLKMPYEKVRKFIQEQGISLDPAHIQERRDDLTAKLVTMNSLLAIANGEVLPGGDIRPPREF